MTGSLSHLAKRHKIENLLVAPENMGKHFICKIEGKFVFVVRGWVGKQVGGIQ